MKYPYDNSYSPPIPGLEIRLGIPDEAFTIGPLEGIIDTGSDATIVPLRYLRGLGVEPTAQKYLVSPWGGRLPVDIYTLDVGIAQDRLPALDIVADERNDEVIIGRDILNKLVVTLNGPRQELELVVGRR